MWCRDGDGRRCELGVTVDGRDVVLELPGDATLLLDLQNYDRLKHLLIVAGNESSWSDVR